MVSSPFLVISFRLNTHSSFKTNRTWIASLFTCTNIPSTGYRRIMTEFITRSTAMLRKSPSSSIMNDDIHNIRMALEELYCQPVGGISMTYPMPVITPLDSCPLLRWGSANIVRSCAAEQIFSQPSRQNLHRSVRSVAWKISSFPGWIWFNKKRTVVPRRPLFGLW